MLLTLVEWSIRSTFWSLSTVYGWLFPRESLEQRVDRLTKQLEDFQKEQQDYRMRLALAESRALAI